MEQKSLISHHCHHQVLLLTLNIGFFHLVKYYCSGKFRGVLRCNLLIGHQQTLHLKTFLSLIQGTLCMRHPFLLPYLRLQESINSPPGLLLQIQSTSSYSPLPGIAQLILFLGLKQKLFSCQEWQLDSKVNYTFRKDKTYTYIFYYLLHWGLGTDMLKPLFFSYFSYDNFSVSYGNRSFLFFQRDA